MATLDTIIEAVLNRTGESSTGQGLIVSNHLAQMRLFGIRQGVELYPITDQDGTRKRFIDKLYRDNKLELFLDRIWDLFLCKGQILWYLRPTGNFYRIYHYSKDQFRAFYDADGELVKVIIIYSYNVDSEIESIDRKQWVRLEITKDKIRQSESSEQPAFTGPMSVPTGPSVKESENSLGFIPCVVANNYLVEAGQDGKGDFDWLKTQIEAHEDMMGDIQGNLQFFGTPTLVTTRTAVEVTEAYGMGDRNTAASSQQWIGMGPGGGSTFKRDPASGGGRERIRRVIGGVDGTERFGYVLPDPISPDQARFATEFRQSLHAALGGLDPVGISQGSTAYQVKSIYGTVAATARKKALHLYTYGLCKLIEMAIASEEKAFKAGLRRALNMADDEPPMSDRLCMMILQVLDMSPEEIKRQKPPNEVVSMVKQLGPEFRPEGLPPLGDRSIGWKWLGPVFEDSPQDLVQRSIVVRNLEEVGVETTEALGFLFPDKTEVERKQMLTGFPFREMGQSASTLNQHLNILNQMLNLPSPNMPGQPLAAEMNNMQAISRTIDHINKRLEYGNPRPEPADDAYVGGYSSAPSGGADGPNPGSVPNPGVGGNGPGVSAYLWPGGSVPGAINASGYAAGLGTGPQLTGSPTAGNAGSGSGVPEYATGIPAPGGTTERISDAGTPGTSGTAANPAGIAGIPTDLASQPGILRTLFPSFFGIAESVSNGARNASRRATGKRGSKPPK